MVEIREKFMFGLELFYIIFEYLKEQLGLTVLDKFDWSDRVVTIALFVKKRRKELLELLMKHAKDNE